MRFGSTRSVTTSIADDYYWYGWVNLDVDEWMLSVSIALSYEESRSVELLCNKRTARL